MIFKRFYKPVQKACHHRPTASLHRLQLKKWSKYNLNEINFHCEKKLSLRIIEWTKISSQKGPFFPNAPVDSQREQSWNGSFYRTYFDLLSKINCYKFQMYDKRKLSTWMCFPLNEYKQDDRIYSNYRLIKFNRILWGNARTCRL